MVVPHAVALLVLLLIWPGLCCCCVWPEKYPVCRKFRKPEKEMYGKCELKWPAYLAIFIYLLVCVSAAAALSGGPNVTNDYSNIGCQVMAVADDTLNGRISPTDDSAFFVGISPLYSELTSFDSGLNTFFTSSNTSLNNSQSIRTLQTGIEGQLTSEYSTYTDITYSNAFRAADGVTYSSVDSEFKTMYYGPTTDDTKILGNIYSQLSTLFDEINVALDPLIDKWVYLEGETEAVVQGRLTDTQASILDYETQLNQVIESYGFFDKASDITGINYGIKILYGLILALGLLGLVSAVLIACCSVVRVRLVLYCSCSFLLFLGMATFALLICLGIMVPNYAQFCKYADELLSTPAGIEYLFGKLKFSGAAPLYQDCYGEGATGNMVQYMNPDFSNDLVAMTLIATSTLQFNDLIPNFNTANFNQPFTQAAAVVLKVKENEVYEITDSTAIDFLEGLAVKAYTKDLTCSSANVNGDSWVPTKNLVDCELNRFSQPVCTNLADFMVCPAGCYEMYWELTDPAGDSGAYQSHLSARYGNPCNYVNYITDLHQQWTLPRVTKMQTVTSNLAAIQTTVLSYDTSMKTIQASLNSFKSNLETNFNSETNLTSGSFNGLDCRVVGETIQEMRDSFCVGFLYSLNYNFIMLTIISYSILLLGCVSVCTGVRHFQHLQKMQVKVGYKGVPVSISSNRIIDKFDS